MILTCPSCATRYQADEAKFPAAGRQVRCAKCGTVWHQAAPAPEESAVPQPEPEITIEAPQPVREAAESDPVPAVPVFAGALPPVEEKPRLPLLSMLGIGAGWVGLILVVLLIGFAAVRYRQEIAVIWPQSAGVYSSLGLKVNAHGVDFANVDYHRESEDGQIVLAVTGAIINNGDRELPVPQIVRVTLNDASNHEIYHWNFTPGATTLKPKKSVPFVTRLSSPPAAARHLEVRFAKDAK